MLNRARFDNQRAAGIIGDNCGVTAPAAVGRCCHSHLTTANGILNGQVAVVLDQTVVLGCFICACNGLAVQIQSDGLTCGDCDGIGQADILQQNDYCCILGSDSLSQCGVADLICITRRACRCLNSISDRCVGVDGPCAVAVVLANAGSGNHDLKLIILVYNISIECAAVDDDICRVLALRIEDPGLAVVAGSNITQLECTAVDGDCLIAIGEDQRVTRLIQLVSTVLNDHTCRGIKSCQQAVYCVSCCDINSTITSQCQVTILLCCKQTNQHIFAGVFARDSLAVQVDGERLASNNKIAIVLVAQTLLELFICNINILQQNASCRDAYISLPICATGLMTMYLPSL